MSCVSISWLKDDLQVWPSGGLYWNPKPPNKNKGNGCLWLLVVFPSTEKSQEATSICKHIFQKKLPQKNGHIFRCARLLGLPSCHHLFDPSPLRKSPEPLNRILVEEHVIRSYSIYVYKNMYVQMNGQTLYKTPHRYPVSFGFLPLPCRNLF